MIPFNKPFLTGRETEYIQDAVASGKLSGNGIYTQKSQRFFCQEYGFNKCLLTSSCTDALEMSALLVNIQPGDEVIMPSFTFVSTANAFVLRGASIVFADSREDHPGIDEERIEGLITSKTRAIVVVHYAGVACDMNRIMSIAAKYNLFVVEDAAQAIDSSYNGKALGGIGDLGAFSFHETKNVISGEGGLLSINNEKFLTRSEVIWEKGTNRSAFWRGEVNKYGWIDVGSSFLPSEVVAAFLWAQLENIGVIQFRRKEIWQLYFQQLQSLLDSEVGLPVVPYYATNNAHMFYLVCRSIEERSRLIEHLKAKGITAVFHYQSLHKSPYYADKHDGRILPNSDRYESCLVRLPLFFDLSNTEVDYITSEVLSFFGL